MERQMAPWLARGLPVTVGFLTGAFLFHQFGWNHRSDFSGWQWYQGAALLAGIGLAGTFREEMAGTAVALVAAPTLAVTVETFLQIFRDPTCCNLWPIGLAMVFFFSLPAPLIGTGIGFRLLRTGLPRTAYAVALTGALGFGAFLPHVIQSAKQRTVDAIPGILYQIHEGEMAYRASQPDGSFTCDGTQLPGAAGKLAWERSPNSTNSKTYLNVRQYFIFLDCSVGPASFLVKATTGYPNPDFSIDQTGKLIVTSR
jgi:hypothetical protein